MPSNLNSSIVQLCPAAPDRIAKYFNEIFVSDIINVPAQKPDMADIVDITPEITIEMCETIDVTLPDGTIGKKIFVVGNIFLKIQYVSTNENQSVHFIRYQLPFQTFILEPCNGLIPSTDTIFPDNYVVHVCIEKITKKVLTTRTAFIELLLLVWVEET